MLKKLLPILLLSSLTLFGMSIQDIQNNSEKELSCIKGVGQKKLSNIIEYKKEHQITQIEDLLKVKGIGKKILENIKNDVKKKSCLIDKKAPIPKSIPRIKKDIEAQ
jgi:competence ComEA-like helix-hairpin-helix protein